ncbi:TPA: hypothetical protein NJT26_002614 [Clostridium perfringens]|nr:hypothetical protein CPBEC5_10350 [Clostridium perfringens]HCG3019730.1 hypothetical protein [Clostridium perfringens]
MLSRVNKINNRTVAALGIKSLDENLEKSIVNIINCNSEYIILGCSEIPFTERILKALNNANCPKILILPFNYRFRNQREVVNEIKLMKNFSENNIAIILNSVNDANFILTDKICYISSGSLNNNGIANNVNSYEIMNKKDCNYKLWESEIFDFINKEIINYRSNDQREQIEYILKELKKRLFINISNSSNILNEEYIYILLDILNSIDRFIMIGTDVYQYFDRDFLDIIKGNKKILAKINSIRNELFRILLNINEGKNDINTKIFNCLKNEFLILLEELEELINLRENKYHNSIMPWRKERSIISFLSANNTINNSLIIEFYERIILNYER